MDLKDMLEIDYKLTELAINEYRLQHLRSRPQFINSITDSTKVCNNLNKEIFIIETNQELEDMITKISTCNDEKDKKYNLIVHLALNEPIMNRKKKITFVLNDNFLSFKMHIFDKTDIKRINLFFRCKDITRVINNIGIIDNRNINREPVSIWIDTIGDKKIIYVKKLFVSNGLIVKPKFCNIVKIANLSL